MKFNWTHLLLSLAPIGLAAAGVPPVIIPTVLHAMTEAQSIIGAAGPQKKDHVLNIVRDAGVTLVKIGALSPAEHAAVIETTSSGIDTSIALVNRVLDAHPAPGA